MLIGWNAKSAEQRRLLDLIEKCVSSFNISAQMDAVMQKII